MGTVIVCNEASYDPRLLNPHVLSTRGGLLRCVKMESGPDMIVTKSGRSLAIIDIASSITTDVALQSAVQRCGCLLSRQDAVSPAFRCASECCKLPGQVMSCVDKTSCNTHQLDVLLRIHPVITHSSQIACRVTRLCTCHEFVYVLADQPQEPSSGSLPFNLKLAAQLAAGTGAKQQSARQPSIIFIHRGACRAAAVLDLAAAMAQARQQQRGTGPQQSTLDSGTVAAGLEAVSSAGAVEAWKGKCAAAFGVGFTTNVLELCDMAAAEHMERSKGRPGCVAPEITSLFCAQV